MKKNKKNSGQHFITFYKSFFLFVILFFSNTNSYAQIRQDLNSLTAANRTTLVNLMRDYIDRGVIEDHCSYTVRAGQSTLDIHSDVNFLPFHRVYIEALEDYLIRRGFPQFVPLPYWNPSTAVPTEFRLVDADCGTVSCANSTINCNNPTNWAPNRARPRYLSLPVQAGTYNDLCDFPFTTNSDGLSRVIEGENNIVNSTYHNSVHSAMGGAMGQFTSPAAPIFFCWHAYVDDIWKQYQCSCTNGGGKALDLYMKDTPKVPHSERDGGNEPNIDNGSMTVSTDIWVRNQNDGVTNQINQNPISGTTNYVFVRVRNRGCQSSTGNEQLRLQWSKGATAMTWPGFWDGSTPVNGNVISTVNIPAMAPGTSTILAIQWNPPSPANYPGNTTPSLFGLLARIIATSDPMTIAEGSTVATNIRNNNNIVSRNVTVNQGNIAPTVTITAPANNASFTAPASISITANAADSDGSIARVEFYQGSTLLGSDATSPYSYSWTSVAAGNYAITAKAVDNLNASTNSTVVTVSVTSGNVAPTATITSPVNNASFTAPANISITASAADSDGNIARVEFYQGTTLLGSDETAPYGYSWSNVAAGNYAITAKAIDNLNATTTSSVVNITVSAGGNTSPTVNITAPLNNASFTAPANITITANAADSDGSIARVEFYQGATFLGSDASSPYAYSWSGVAAGNYTITAVAIDDLNASTTSSVINVTVSSSAFSINMQNTTVTNCTGTLYDDGGPTANYQNSRTYTLVINPGATALSMSFSQWGLESNYDFLRIYNGTSTSSPLIGTYSATNPGTVTASSGSMTLRFTSDASVAGIGWTSNWTATGGNCAAGKREQTITSIEDLTIENSIRIYPNPVSDKITIDFTTETDATTQISVYDISGKEIVLFNKILPNGKHALSFDTGTLTAGLYLCKITEGEKISLKKFIKIN